MFRELRFNILCQRHCDEIFRYALTLLGNRADAEEITQDALLKLWENLDKVPFAKARAWTYRTARNLCLDQIRKRNSRLAPVSVPEDFLSEHADEGAPDPRATADAEFIQERLTAALLELPEQLRSVLVLYEINGLRYREVAETLGIPINTVKVYLLRARMKFKEELTQREVWIRKYID